MNENMKKFTEQLATDPALAEKMAQIQAQYVKSLTALAKEVGYDLSEEDFILKDEQLSEEELAGVAGGMSRYRLRIDFSEKEPECISRRLSES